MSKVENKYFESRLCPQCVKPTLVWTPDVKKIYCDRCNWKGELKQTLRWDKK